MLSVSRSLGRTAAVKFQRGAIVGMTALISLYDLSGYRTERSEGEELHTGSDFWTEGF